MIQHLPVLQVLIPLLAAPLCVLLRRPLAAWACFSLASAAAFACAIALLHTVSTQGPLSYAMGNWPAPFGIVYVIDAANAWMLVLVAGAALATAIYARVSVAAEIEARRIYLYYACLCLCLTGLLGIVATGDAFNVFVFLEISSLSSYALIAMGRHRRALLSAFQYLIVGTIGGTFLLIGIGLAYALTGTLNMADLQARLPDADNRALVAALAFVGIGLSIKMALVPLHAWLPGAYSEAPSAASLFLAACGTKVAVYALLRFLFSAFGVERSFEALPLTEIGLLLGSLAMLVGAAMACLQTDLKRLLAWSSIGQIGYIVAGFSLATPDGLSASFLHLLNHAVIKAALFALAGLLLLRLGSTRLEALAGLRQRLPLVFAALLLAGLGLVGMPLTAGFVSKWALVQALIAQAQWAVVAAVLISSLLAVVYVGRIIEVAWFRPPPAESRPARSAPLSMQAVIWTLVLLSLWLGLDSEAPARLAGGAADALLGGAR